MASISSTMVPSFVLAVVLSLAAILVFTHALWLTTDGRRRRLPPGPWPLPVIGSVHAVKWSRPHRSLARHAERHGPLMSIWFGRYPVVVVSTPDAARKVLACSDLAGRTVLDTMRAEGHADNCVIVLPPGPKWRAIRRLVMAEVMAGAQLAAREELRQEKARELVRHVAERAARGEAVDLGHAAFVTAVDLVSRTLLSVKCLTRILYRPAGRTTLDGRYRTSNICAEIRLPFGRLTNVDSERSTRHRHNPFPIHTSPVQRGWLPMEASRPPYI